ncbi:hypothetical protein A3860_28125 [Niastella vici]|uniref:T6SS Phospholipase effector Tle1-like catalytic domain-containing protein n=1 Tax=Niastella vici TaxID=1703345 RepID=A0A1V9FW40_9BACT|nr:DUF2235 domain-containing protein [Niastella vici]OQP62561.1 hypothetical protein A3860_28125 [Niastella vici]
MKRLITCSDGTWNKPGNIDRGVRVETNVEKMYQCICAYDTANNQIIPQLKFYDKGIGTGYSWKSNLMGGIRGAGIDKNIKDIYTFLILNYEPGDEIYLFGFSRGAYTARSIGGLIRNCGILRPEYIELVDKAYDLYRARDEYTKPESDMMVGFRRQYARENVTPIKFIGVWDTVGSLGIPLPWYRAWNMKKYQFHDVTLSSTVQNAYQALAIDERRRLFAPTLWKVSDTVKNDPNHPQKVEQRWFAGVHSNIGGGYADTGLSDIALQWLSVQAHKTGLCYERKEYEQIKGNPWGELRNSYTPLFWLWPPVWRSITLNDDTNQTIDESVLERFREMYQYRPRNLRKYVSIDNSEKSVLI